MLQTSRTMLTLPLPPGDEAAPFYASYLANVPDGRIAFHLQAQSVDIHRLCGALSEAAAGSSYANGKWTVKEVIGHLVDAERIFAYRLLRISRGDTTPLPGFDENAYAPEGQFNRRDVGDLLSEFALQRASTGALVNGIPPSAWARIGTMSGHRTSARALAFIIIGHTAHHVGVLRERYLLGK
jgi:uncharacterized damage-inducible protein DinB